MENPLRDRPAPRGLTLIETGYWDGAALRHEHLHRARLGSGAAALGWTVPDFHVSGPDRPARWRLTLDAAGVIRQEHHPLPPDIDTWRVGLSDLRLASDDPWLRLKSSQRATYDAARAALPQGLDEVILLNERDEVCDGTITTVFFDRGAGMRTPPLACGLLPGVLRAQLACPEEVLLARDLPHVRLWLGNALRGLRPARFIL
ncbi:MAG: 4-amino-4-deoxychorismate lyase PabC [Roseibaca calidilacus]|uniref:4-amino-4-deoxychorismate lyase n=1 Tax=Roseibaca calidilacus TaxID=1666912 RepID=A0A0P7VWZ0_9RHOB|nr:aminotransferase class IV [Roseibaca calidilacus]KPP91672.1 MAG: 4-amino-4-deoxychorismate lyase PabC [Roseibaca calidilacus]CUX82715.1 4-amino-4-deoxychorismate lyase [Roseibaca calidilacus]